MAEERPATTLTLKSPNAYRLLLGLKVRNVGEDVEEDNKISVSDTPVEICGTTWMLRARRQTNDDEHVQIELHAAGADSIISGLVRASVLCPAGTVLRKFEWRQFEIHTKCASPNCSSCFVYLRVMDVDSAIDEGWVFDGDLHISAEVFLDADQLRPSSGIPVGRIMNSMAAEIKNPTLSDFILISADGHRIKAYKLVLAAISPVFRAMFATDCQETREGCCKIEDADAETINAMFAGICDADVGGLSFELLKSVFQLADRYEMMELKDSCASKLSERINLENVFDLLMLADKHSAQQLKTRSFVFLKNNLLEATTQDIPLKLNSANKDLYEEWMQHLRTQASQKRRSTAPTDHGVKRARVFF